MTMIIVGSLVLGVLCGYFLLPNGLPYLSLLTDGALALLLFTVGFDLAQGDDLGQKIKDLPKIALAVPFLVALGSLCGSLVGTLFLDLPLGEGVLVGAGLGWYSLSAVIIAQSYDVTIGALALLANVFREVLAILLIPLIARKLGPLPAIAPGGATTMDVTLPIISQSTDTQTTLVAFYSGTVLTALIPFLVPLVIKLLQLLS